MRRSADGLYKEIELRKDAWSEVSRELPFSISQTSSAACSEVPNTTASGESELKYMNVERPPTLSGKMKVADPD